MVCTKNKAQIPESPANPIDQEKNGDKKNMSDYERSREERIKENLEKMQKLGIHDISLKLKSLNPNPKAKSTLSIRRTVQNLSPLTPPGPLRRSSRLQNVTPVAYSDIYWTKKDECLEIQDDLLRDVGSKPEVYTSEHEKLLGNTEMGWTLFVDGCGKDGKRIYDPVNGKTCHQCRQKTLGHRTHCSKCKMVQGQFCGDCLYMRYGEHVLEANQNSNWICPVCRGICNCSLCRQAKGWPPTGPLYRKISSLGFKSVAHYLIQTRRFKTDIAADSGSKVPVSVKKSLPFSHVAAISIEKVSSEFNHNPQGLENIESEGKMTDYCLDKQEGLAQYNHNPQGLENRESEGKMTDYCLDDKQEGSMQFLHDNDQSDGNLNRESSSELIREQPRIHNAYECRKKRVRTTEPDGDSIAGRLRLRLRRHKGNTSPPGRTENFVEPSDSTMVMVASVTSPKSNKKHLHMSEPSPDSIAGRLRRRRSEGKSSGL